MRKTTLYQTSGIVVVALLVIAITLGIVRNVVVSRDGKEGAHTHEGHQLNDSQATLGRALFDHKGCAQCHFTDSPKPKVGPGLKGLFDKKALPVSGRPMTKENVKLQLKTPYEDMPEFEDRLTGEEREQIIAYLRTL
ncbi:MAG: c-type cytochrome [Thermodesulfobacteriota bacterium]